MSGKGVRGNCKCNANLLYMSFHSWGTSRLTLDIRHMSVWCQLSLIFLSLCSCKSRYFFWWDLQLEFGINFFCIFWQIHLHSSGSVAPDVVYNRMLERSSTGTSFLIAAMKSKNSPLHEFYCRDCISLICQTGRPEGFLLQANSCDQWQEDLAGGCDVAKSKKGHWMANHSDKSNKYAAHLC